MEYTKDLLQKYELSADSYFELAEYCKSWTNTCVHLGMKKYRIAEEIGVKRYKVASADFDNVKLIECILATGKPIILSTGMATVEQIRKRVEFLDARSWTIHFCIVTALIRLLSRISNSISLKL